MQPLLPWKNIKYYTGLFCVSVALVIQCAMCMHHTVISGLIGSTIFFPISHTQHVFFLKNVTEHKICVLIFPSFV
jgi:hypothetical protein